MAMSASLRPFAGPILLALSAVALSGVVGLAFAGWMEHAPGIFLALVEQGMAWCF